MEYGFHFHSHITVPCGVWRLFNGISDCRKSVRQRTFPSSQAVAKTSDRCIQIVTMATAWRNKQREQQAPRGWIKSVQDTNDVKAESRRPRERAACARIKGKDARRTSRCFNYGSELTVIETRWRHKWQRRERAGDGRETESRRDGD